MIYYSSGMWLISATHTSNTTLSLWVLDLMLIISIDSETDILVNTE